MGGDGYGDEKPIHLVKLTKGFYLGVHPATQAQWRTVMGNNPSNFNGDDRPVERISWHDCQGFCAELTQLTGKPIRLPTETEWEYACRSGFTTDYHGGSGEEALKRVGWYSGNSQQQTQPVGKLAANAWGLYDMHGNVWEWCQDWYGSYPSGNLEDYEGPNRGDIRVVRGGSWYSNAKNCRAASRFRVAPGRRMDLVGCRVCFCPD
jgi:formylglycine-generating enzyme required for sulfatase activity